MTDTPTSTSQNSEEQQQQQQQTTNRDAQGRWTPSQETPGTDGYNFPADTPLEKMTDEQRAEYWRHKARKWEKVADKRADYDDKSAELEKLRREKLSEQERAVEEARDETRAEVAKEYTKKIAQATITGALKSAGLTDDEIETKLKYVDMSVFVGDNGDVDSKELDGYLAGAMPNTDSSNSRGDNAWPDMGGGKRGSDRLGRTGGSIAKGREKYRAARKQQQ